MDFKEYIHEIDRLYHVGNTTEHSFRGTLASYLQSILENFVVTNEPRRIDCGAPDYVITQNNIPVAFLEAKDIDDSDLDGKKEHKAQFKRYKESLDRIIFTDYLDFHMYVGGEFVDSVRIAETKGNHIIGIPENEQKFNEIVLYLATEGRQRITSSSTLAKHMAAKAHLLADAVKKRLKTDGEDGNGDIPSQLRAFRNVLIHDLKAEDFADIYAQTIAYGLFTARLYDKTPEDFSRQEAAGLIPKSNPFLRKIFYNIAGIDLDDGIAWIVDDLASMFAATDSERIMRNYGSNKRHSDPIVHFYEDFLAAYDPKLRKSRGVWYTPAPVVKFIVKSVDEILQRNFGLSLGLADDSKIKVDHALAQTTDGRTKDGKKHELRDVHRVQILDPATGTGTFLAEVIQQVRDKFDGMEGMWPSFVEKNLIPRLHGFELLMASYTIAHLKLSLSLKASGYENQTNQRFKVYLTNSLEEATPRAENLFSNWLSDEADSASLVKSQTPVMICIGNPPYSGISSNNGKWITDQIEEYKYIDGVYFNERKHWLNDDYVKFIRLAQGYINKNKNGIIGYINNNAFLDNPTFRGMRWNLLRSFDDIYILNLHGNAMQHETAPDGGKDENVFDIRQGVSINIFIKTGKKKEKELGKVHYCDLWGTRASKYDFLEASSISTVSFDSVIPSHPLYLFRKIDESYKEEYNSGFSINELLPYNVTGIVTARDSLVIDIDREALLERIKDFCNTNSTDDVIRNKYFGTKKAGKYPPGDSRGWSLVKARRRIAVNEHDDIIQTISYRPFDDRYIYYTPDMVDWGRENILTQIIPHGCYALVVSRQAITDNWSHVLFANNICDNRLFYSNKGISQVCPIFHDEKGTLVSNLNQSIVASINDRLETSVSDEDIVDYVYAVLHSNKYREKYLAFLKIDFPRIPYPQNHSSFSRLAAYGRELRKLHLMEDASSWPRTVSFPVQCDSPIDRYEWKDGRVYINEQQYFGNVPEKYWNFYIGGYQPAQKWLKDRKGRKLDYNDILHYGHIIYALEQTDRIMKEIDEVGVV